MRNLSSVLAITALCSPYTTQAFAPSSSGCAGRTRTHLCASRREFLTKSIATAATVVTSTLVASPLPSLADVSDGNALPKEAAQFSRVIKVRAQLKSVAKRVAEQSSEIDKKEWDEIDNFLRTVYSAGNDMKEVAKGIYDPEKKTKAAADIKLLQNLVQAGQKPVSKQDAAGFGVVATKLDGCFEEFLDLLSDIPDEL